MTAPTQETAIVYRGGRRRWLSLDAACRAEARAKLRTRCECSDSDPEAGDSGEACRYHGEQYSKFVRRLAAIYKAAYREPKP